MKQLISVTLSLLLSIPSWGATINATTCGSTDVQNAINSASTGDTVVIPAGSCNWPVQVNIISKGITLQGQTTCSGGNGTPVTCVDNTNITDTNTDTTAVALGVAGVSASAFLRITGLTIIEGSGVAQSNNGLVNIDGTMFDVAFRMDHIHMVIPDGASRGFEITDIYGLMDHDLVEEASGSNQVVSIWGSPDGTDGGFTPWMQPLTLGTNKAVYVEDSTFTFSATVANNDSGMDSYGGARWVFRHNTVTNNEFCGGHGTDSGNRRSAFSGECYNNTFTNNRSSHVRASTTRGGTGVWYSNTYLGTGGWDGYTLMVYRACPPLDQSAWQTCNGTNWEIGSTSFSTDASRTASTNGGVHFCSGNLDLACNTTSDCTPSGAGACTGFLDGSGTQGYACRDQPGITHGQVVSPVYTWSNTAGITAGPYDGGDTCGAGGIANFLQSGRDFVNGTPMPGYVAYVYPDPLQGGTLASGALGNGASISNGAQIH